MKNSTQATSVDLPTLFAIRDARGLSVAEKAFLFVVASRGKLFASGTTSAADMGMSRSTFTRTARRLVERKLIDAETKPGRPTTYRVRLQAVRGLAHTDQGGHSDQGVRQRDQRRLVRASQGVGHSDQQKRTIRGTTRRDSSMTKKTTLKRRPK